ncbi:site-specific integrase [Pseudomonas sp. NY15437]|uniref:site-specific integrase n=1 Tax=Pseudomonas sp. NY15437 TaxID=3400360 RepID=UPI003A8B8EC6
MSLEVERYLAAATRSNTRRSYQAAIEHFEVSWGGFLPATSDTIARYLADHAGVLSANTLKTRLAALAQWHLSQGFPDPTKAPIVRKVLKGIRVMHPRPEKQAHPMQLQELELCVRHLEHVALEAHQAGDIPRRRRSLRDRALILMGFWRAFRSDELCRLQIEYIEVAPGKGMTIYLPWSKTDRQNLGQTFHAPALARLCPVQAYQDWLDELGKESGPVFRGIDRWGHVQDSSIHPNSVIPILRAALMNCGLPPERYSSHSLRRGFATWAARNGWDQKTLMSYVGWRDPKSALRYVEPLGMFSEQLTKMAP